MQNTINRITYICRRQRNFNPDNLFRDKNSYKPKRKSNRVRGLLQNRKHLQHPRYAQGYSFEQRRVVHQVTSYAGE